MKINPNTKRRPASCPGIAALLLASILIESAWLGLALAGCYYAGTK